MRLATAKPSPEAAPVTIATLPSSLPIRSPCTCGHVSAREALAHAERASRGDGAVLLEERGVDREERGGPFPGLAVAAQVRRPTVVRGVARAREGVAASLRRLAARHRIVAQVVEHDLAPGPRVVADAALEPIHGVEAAPDARVHLHQAEGAGLRAQRHDASAFQDVLPPARLLPGRREHEVVEELALLEV